MKRAILLFIPLFLLLYVATRDQVSPQPALDSVEPDGQTYLASASLLPEPEKHTSSREEGSLPIEELPVPMVSAAGTISGVVVGATNAPLEGAVCEIFQDAELAALSGMIYQEPQPREILGSVLSGPEGAFKIPVPPGLWTLRVSMEKSSGWEESSLQAGDYRRVQLLESCRASVVVSETAGGPISGARVSLVKTAWGDPKLAVLTVNSDSTGIAQLDSIPSGAWFVHVAHPDYIFSRVPLPKGVSVGSTLEVVLEKGIRIEGRVTLKDGSAPPSGSRVAFYTSDGPNANHTVLCDRIGSYASETVFAPYDSLELSVLALGYGESYRDVALEQFPPSGVHREDFLLEMGERFVTGRVLDQAGAPVPGVVLCVKPLESLPEESTVHIPLEGNVDIAAYDPVHTARGQFRQVGETDASGYYRIAGLNPLRSYSLVLVSAEYANAALWIEVNDPGATTDLGTTVLQSAGRVWGHVRRADGTGVEGVLVDVINWRTFNLTGGTTFRTQRPKVSAGSLEIVTGPSGYFSLQPFPAAEFRLVVEGVMSELYRLEAGEELGPIEISIPEKQGSIPARFEIVDAVGAPVPRAYVSMQLVPDQGDPASTAWSWVWDMGDTTGQLFVGARAQGLYDVEIKDLQGQLASQSFQIDLQSGGHEQRVTLRVAQSPPALLEGIVLSADGEAIEGLEVTLVPNTGSTSCGCLSITTQTSVTGEFSYGVFMGGDHRITVTDPRGRFAPVHVYPVHAGVPQMITVK